MALLALGGRPQPLKKPSQSQKGHFYVKMNALNDTKTSAMSKSAEGNGEYLWSSVAFVEAWIERKFPNVNTALKNTQMLHKNKARLSNDEESKLTCLLPPAGAVVPPPFRSSTMESQAGVANCRKKDNRKPVSLCMRRTDRGWKSLNQCKTSTSFDVDWMYPSLAPLHKKDLCVLDE